MNVLAFDTATDNCSAALQVGDIVFRRLVCAPQQHARLLLPMLDELLSEAGLSQAQLDAIVFGQGPGSFTGLRIAAAAAQGIALARRIPVLGISSLQAIAIQNHRLFGHKKTLACIDARMSEVYCGAYEVDDHGVCHAVGEEQVCAPADIPYQQYASYLVAGSGLACCRDLPWMSDDANDNSQQDRAAMLPEAIDMLTAALPLLENNKGECAASAVPVYLRNKVALTEKERAAQKQV